MEVVLSGPIGQIPLGNTGITIGRLPINRVVLGKDNQVSGHHAEIRPQAQGYSIIDLGSTNGTFVNGQRLTPDHPLLLRFGDVIRIGQTTFTYEISSATHIAPTGQLPQWGAQQPAYRLPPTNQQQWSQQSFLQSRLLPQPLVPHEAFPQQSHWSSQQYWQQPFPIQPPQYYGQQPSYALPYYQPPIQPIMVINQISTQAMAQSVVAAPSARSPQLSFLIRVIYFLCIGWWLGIFWATIAIGFCITILGAPIGLMMLHQLPVVLTLHRN